MTQSQVLLNLSQIFCDIFFLNEIELKPEFTSKDIEGWDSFKQVEIILGVEEKFNISLSSKEIDSLKNVGDIVSIIIEKIK